MCRLIFEYLYIMRVLYVHGFCGNNTVSIRATPRLDSDSSFYTAAIPISLLHCRVKMKSSRDHEILCKCNLHLPRSFVHAREFQLERLQTELVLLKIVRT